MRKLRMGIIGMGMGFEKYHYPAYQMLSDKYEIVAICDFDRQKTEKWANILQLQDEDIYIDFRKMLNRPDVDAFHILAPIEFNFEVTREVALAGKPIICEKSLAPNIEETRLTRDLQTKYNIPIMIAENYRYNEEVYILRDIVENKQAGEVVHFAWNRFIDIPQKKKTAKLPSRDWRRQYTDFLAGVILDKGVHDIAALRYIFGEVEKLQSFEKPQQEDFAPCSLMMTNMAFKSGVLGSYAFYSANKETMELFTGLRIFATGGTIYLEERNCGKVEVFYNNGKTESIQYKPQQGYYNELLNFYNILMGSEELKITPEVEYSDVMLMLSMLKSAQEDRILRVDKLQKY